MARTTNPDLLKAVRCDGEYLEFIKLHEITPELRLAAVRQNDNALRFVPKKYRTQEICKAAVENTPLALGCVSWDMLTPDFVAECARDNKDLWRGVVELLEKNPSMYRYLPLALQEHPKLAERAIQLDPSNFAYVPNTLKNQAFCDAFIDAHPDRLITLPYDFRSHENCAKALAYDGLQITAVPSKVLDAELCSLAIRSNSKAYAYLPRGLQSSELASQAEITAQAEKKAAEILNGNQKVVEDLASNVIAPNDNPESIGTRIVCADLEQGTLFVQVHPEILSVDQYQEKFLDLFSEEVSVLSAYFHCGQSEERNEVEKRLTKEISRNLTRVIREYWQTQEHHKEDLSMSM